MGLLSVLLGSCRLEDKCTRLIYATLYPSCLAACSRLLSPHFGFASDNRRLTHAFVGIFVWSGCIDLHIRQQACDLAVKGHGVANVAYCRLCFWGAQV